MKTLDRDALIDRVLEQIRIDIEFGDVTAIAELLEHLPDEYLIGYLPEENE